MSCLTQHPIVAVTTTVFLLGLLAAGLQKNSPSYALPEFSRKYEVGCAACHSVPPRLNPFGLAFQANHFNWPGGRPPAYHAGLTVLPISGIATFSRIGQPDSGTTGTDIRALELYFSDGYSLGTRQGGYFVDYFAATRGQDNHPGNLDNAFITLPLAGPRGQWAVTAGQFTPLMYQYDSVNSLTSALPAALNNDLDNFSFLAPAPGLRLDFFGNRGHRTADGDYLELGVPFEGQLVLNHNSKWDGPHGLYGHAFRRRGDASYGLFGYTHDHNHLEGIIATHELSNNLSVLGIGAIGRDEGGETRRLSIDANYVITPQLALTGRWEMLDGQEHDDFPVAAVTFYPMKQSALRLTAETIQQSGNRSTTLYAYVQF